MVRTRAREGITPEVVVMSGINLVTFTATLKLKFFPQQKDNSYKWIHEK
jgi:hypothetical protein